jgi:hypothetical protein
MLTFRPRKAPTKPEDLPKFIDEQLASVQKAANRGSSHVPLTYLTVLPDKPQDGLYLFDTNVTSGAATRGAYRYDSSTATYTFLA